MKRSWITLFVLIFSSFFASQVQSSFGKVSVQSIKIPTQNGQWLVADLFKPITATSKNPAPAVIVVPGFQRSKETLSNVSIELSRRGIVVFNIDPYAQGGSSSSFSRRAATTEGYGMFALVEYLYNTSNINYVDKNLIGSFGHSAGGLAAIRGAQYFGKRSKKLSKDSELHSVFVSGMVRMGFKEKDIKHIESNVGLSYALYDEGSWQNELKNGDMTRAPEALNLVRHQVADSSISKIEIDSFYGKLKDRNLTVVHNEKVLHPMQPYLFEPMKNQIDFFLKTFNIDQSIVSKNQVWHWKEFFTLIALVCSFLLIVPFAKFLIQLPYFRSLSNPIPTPIPKPSGQGKVIFWATIALSTLIACVSFIPMSELSKTLFLDASTRRQTWFFPQRMNNAIMLWAIVNGSIGLILFYLNYYFFGKKSNIKPKMWGIDISKYDLLKTFALGAVIFAGYFILLNVVYYLFHVDYRFGFIGARTFRPITLLLIPMYMPLFFIFFLSNSLRVNGAMRFEGTSEIKNLFFNSLITASGLILILIVQYSCLWLTGTVFWKEGWLYVNQLYAVVPIMLALPFFQRKFFNMTGKAYLGPIAMTLIFIMILLSNTVSYYPI